MSVQPNVGLNGRASTELEIEPRPRLRRSRERV
jgi:hypothetical protein